MVTKVTVMGVDSGRGPWPSWIFIHDTDIVDRGLIVLFFGIILLFSFFFRCPPYPLKIFLPTLLVTVSEIFRIFTISRWQEEIFALH